ncbi:LDCC motif putative metal-binding protein [Anoxybacter fermentans]|nr:LDCC motif putative metal-binding protein [Anoxybacter fermentans]
MKGWFKRLIEKIAQANEKQYGNKVPSCCADGKPKNINKKNK